MCGIAGLINQGSRPVDPNALRGMAARLRHRGPDEVGAVADANVGLAHARLSIIDLVSGQQPMANADRSVWITFNGEIFNYLELRDELIRRGHRFATQSDTEVIVHLYEEDGLDCVHRLNGQWAFAIWDRNCRRLFLSRDRMGVRPLFYTQVNGGFLFASEVKALQAFPGVARELDLEALAQVFTFWFTLPPRTIFRNIFELPPGHNLTVQDGNTRLQCYWDFEYPAAGCGFAACDPDEKAEELLDLLTDATRIRLRADVPVGAYLSGGLDSTVTAALVRRLHQNRLRTFSVSFADPEFDESAYQREASTYLGTDHEDVRCTYGDIADAFPAVVWHTEKPVVRTAPAPMFRLSGLVRDSGFKVVLTGEGADEIMGGYDIFKEAKVRRFWAAQPQSRLRPLLLRRLYPYLGNVQRQSDPYLRSFFRIRPQDLSSPFFSHLPRWEMTSRLSTFFSADVTRAIERYDPYSELSGLLPAEYSSWSPANQAEYLEARFLLPGYILSSQGDRMAMAHSVESRYPFLDFRVVEFGCRLPPNLKLRGLTEKYLLKRAARGIIPASIVSRSKQPYRAPDGKSFFNGAPRDYVAELLSPGALAQAGLFGVQAVARLVAKFNAGQAIGVKDDMALVGILSTQLVVHQFITNRPQQPLDRRIESSPTWVATGGGVS